MSQEEGRQEQEQEEEEEEGNRSRGEGRRGEERRGAEAPHRPQPRSGCHLQRRDETGQGKAEEGEGRRGERDVCVCVYAVFGSYVDGGGGVSLPPMHSMCRMKERSLRGRGEERRGRGGVAERESRVRRAIEAEGACSGCPDSPAASDLSLALSLLLFVCSTSFPLACPPRSVSFSPPLDPTGGPFSPSRHAPSFFPLSLLLTPVFCLKSAFRSLTYLAPITEGQLARTRSINPELWQRGQCDHRDRTPGNGDERECRCERTSSTAILSSAAPLD